MLALRVILRYAIYVFVGGWMFFLGIMVGRGNSPVQFDTQNFHKRLETIVREFEKKEGPEEKMDLQFYDALNKPVLQEVKGKKNTPDEIIPKRETGQSRMPVVVEIPVKTSLKAATLNKTALKKSLFKGSKDAPAKSYPARDRVVIAKAITKKEKQLPKKDTGTLAGKRIRKEPSKNIIEKKSSASEDASAKTGGTPAGQPLSPGMYTIQVAAYKSFTDAVTQMAILEKKGFDSYRTLGKKEGITWYRVRVGAFATRDAANRYVGKLKQAKIDGMIIKKE